MSSVPFVIPVIVSLSCARSTPGRESAERLQHAFLE
jgi:hypothetical protein